MPSLLLPLTACVFVSTTVDVASRVDSDLNSGLTNWKHLSERRKIKKSIHKKTILILVYDLFVLYGFLKITNCNILNIIIPRQSSPRSWSGTGLSWSIAGHHHWWSLSCSCWWACVVWRLATCRSGRAWFEKETNWIF